MIFQLIYYDEIFIVILNMKISGKKGYYSFVIGIGILSIVLSFLNLNFHNKYPNKITIQNTLHQYLNILNAQNKFSNDSIFSNYTFPFKISFNSDQNSKQFDMKYNEIGRASCRERV